MNKHGGDIRGALERFNIPENRIVDFSANINPLGPHPEIADIMKQCIGTLIHYPDPECRKLVTALSDYHSTAKENLLPGNGSTELLYLLAQVLAPESALIVQPNFSEYQQSLLPLNCRVTHLAGKESRNFKPGIEDIIENLKGHKIVYLSSPNNPAGYTYSAAELHELHRQCKRHKTVLFIDEVFIDFLENSSDAGLIQHAGNKNLVILRSLTKFYAIPGLRLGFIIGGKQFIAKMKSRIIPWSVNSVAQLIGASVIRDMKYRDRTIAYVRGERNFLMKQLSGLASLKCFPSCANYILCKITSGITTFQLEEVLGKKGILIRNCSNYRGLNDRYFRIAVKKRKENLLLVNTLKIIFK